MQHAVIPRNLVEIVSSRALDGARQTSKSTGYLRGVSDDEVTVVDTQDDWKEETNRQTVAVAAP